MALEIVYPDNCVKFGKYILIANTRIRYTLICYDIHIIISAI